MNVLFVPSLGLSDSIELLDRLAASVDYDVKWKVVLNNGIPGILDDWEAKHPGWIVKEPDCGNRGVAGSWNWIAKQFPDEASILIVNEDAWFLPGYLQKICEAADAYPDEPVIYLNDSQRYYAFVWNRAGREKFGTFDENFWLGYYEDCDYSVRMRLAGKTDFVYALQGLPPMPHGKPHDGGTNYSAMLQGCGLFNRAYWLRKWGNQKYDEAVYKTPYNDHRLSVKDWVWYPEERSKRYPLWDTFMSLPNPSMYG